MTDRDFRYENILDIHCHILPDIDDGPKTWDESLEMAKIAVEGGARAIIATPHWIQGTNWQPGAETVMRKVSELNDRLRENHIPLTIYAGMEVAITDSLSRLAAAGRILTLAGGRHLLVEIPFTSLPLGIEQILFHLQAEGITPILAHPERSKEIQKNPKRVLDFVESGCLAQITASSFTGYFGEKAFECAVKLAQMGVIHAIASDGHSRRERPPVAGEGLRALEEVVGRDKVLSIIQSAYELLPRQMQAIGAL
ncbi:MAG: tyrosine-protein phosphatase [Deltaproteobacteria bacterium]